MEEAVVHFADEFSKNSIRRILRAFHLIGRRNPEEKDNQDDLSQSTTPKQE